MEPINPSSSNLLNDIMAGLRTRYAYLNDIPRAPMLNSPTKDDAVGNAFYARVVRRVWGINLIGGNPDGPESRN
jgi:hypothetical protein